MQQHRDIEGAAHLQLGQNRRGHGVVFGIFTVFDPRQHADRPNGVLVDRVDVVHVVLHLRHHPAEVGNEAAEDARLVQAAERRLRVPLGSQDRHEMGVGLRVALQLAIDQPQIARDQLQGSGVDVQVALVRHAEEADHRDRIALEGVFVRHVQPLAIGDEALDLAAAQAEARHPETRASAMSVFHRGAEDPGEVPHLLGDQIIVLHEALDAARARMVGVSQAGAEFRLHVERQPLLGPADQEMQVAAQGAEELMGLVEGPLFLRRQHALFDQAGHLVGAIEILGDPVERLQIA